MKRGEIRKNNRGDSLILVIGCIALLSVLGIVILSKTMDNQAMKLSEKKAQETFFEADSTSAELASILEAIAQDAVEDAFEDLMVEYSFATTGTERTARYKDFFTAAVMEELSGTDRLKNLLEAELGTTVTGLSIAYGTITPDTPTVTPAPGTMDVTDIIRIPGVEITYSASGSMTTIKTDICIQAKVPDVEAGFRAGTLCNFSTFALITEASTGVASSQDLEVTGNLYVGGDLNVTASGAGLKVTNPTKVLVRGDLDVESGGAVTVESSNVLSGGNGIWAKGITVKNGTVDTENVNIYVADDLTVEQTNSVVSLKGTGSEYIGYSGGKSTLPSYQRSSAITINNASDLNLDLSGLGKVYINGNSYIRDEKWGTGVDGILQGESVAYKDMQAMYLVPGSLMVAEHNPVLSGESDAVKNEEYYFGPGNCFRLSDYLDDTQKYVTRVSPLDGGGTIATYVYLNFKNEEAAAKYVTDYLSTDKGTAIREQIKNLGTGSRILLPADTKTLSTSLTYDGSALTMRPAADAGQKLMIESSSQSAKQRYNSLFSNLELTGGLSAVPDDYRMVTQKILVSDAFDGLAPGAIVEASITDPVDSTKHYRFVLCNGNLNIGVGSPYQTYQGILVVKGNLTISASNTNIAGLVLAGGEVHVGADTKLSANENIVNALLAADSVAKYFNGYSASSGDVYLSSEAVDITFENWERK